MNRAIQFSELQDEQAPDTCELCRDACPVFFFHVTPPAEARGSELLGYCCLPCGQQLLASMEELILADWATDSDQVLKPAPRRK
jgi:hypothetical protein